HWSRRPEVTESRFWTRWVGWVMRHRWLSALATAGVLIVMTAPAFTMTLGNSMLRQFDSSHEVRGGMAAAAQALGPGALGPVRVLVDFPDGAASSPVNAGSLDAIGQALRQAPHVASVSPPAFADDDRSALLSAVLAVDPEDLAARQSVDWLRTELPQLPGIGSAQIEIGGPTALIKDFDHRVAKTEPLVLIFVAAIAFVMLLLAIQSVVLAIKGVLMTMLSVGAAYGSLVVVFQWGWLERFGFAPLNSIDSTIPPLVLAMTFGLSMDYEIFLLTRIRERFLASGNTHDAVAYGVSTSARTITSAALIMIAVFIGFAFAGMPLVAQLGVACAVAIAIDATLVRLVLVPALMAVFAEWNWWLPGWLARILPSVDFEKPLPDVDLGDVVRIPDDISALVAPAADLRMVMKSSARLKRLVPAAVSVVDPLAFSGCQRTGPAAHLAPALVSVGADSALARRLTGRPARAAPRAVRPVHPVTVWRCRLMIALDALETEADLNTGQLQRCSPVEITNVQLATGDRLQIPTAAETVRLMGYLLMSRNSRHDYAEFAELVDAVEPAAAAVALADIDRHYRARSSQRQWIASQLVGRLADPQPTTDPVDDDLASDEPGAEADWDDVRRRCLAVAVAMLE
ncbi:MAG TPA: MMPL family transporter, partial [Mycobacterium sp.]|nr:MMPL family transporter [Mycobacterium sp.]